MSLSYRKKINLGNGGSLNVSKSGISVSQRTSWGSYSSKGFSIKSGIPGLSYRGSFKGKKGLVTLFILALIAVSYAAILIAWNALRFVWWAMVQTFNLSAQGVILLKEKYQQRKAIQ
jgi:hypothetical protein